MPVVAQSILISLVANAASFSLAAWVFDGFSVTIGWLIAAIALFTALTVVLRAVVTRAAPQFARVSAILGGLALTLVALFLTDLVVPEGFEIHGWVAWIGVPLIVWAAGVAYGGIDDQAPAETPGASPL